MIDSVVGFHIEPTNICTLKCAGCARTQFIKQWPQHWQNHSLDIDQTMNFLDIDLSGKVINFCGNYGDPIYHPDLINFVQKFKSRNAIVNITTNGSYKTANWWENLVDLLTDKDRITFSIDGLPENFTEYRNNADWSSINTGIDIASRASVKTQWKYIPFSYNQTNIDLARDLSASLGIDTFLVTPSDRFDVNTDYLKPSTELLGSRYTAQSAWKTNNAGIVQPKCQNNREHYISASGHYSPCCFVADHRFYYKTDFGKNKKYYSIADHTLSQVLSSAKVLDFYQNLDQQPACQFNCPG